jgi:hypothetical protein
MIANLATSQNWKKKEKKRKKTLIDQVLIKTFETKTLRHPMNATTIKWLTIYHKYLGTN